MKIILLVFIKKSPPKFLLCWNGTFNIPAVGLLKELVEIGVFDAPPNGPKPILGSINTIEANDHCRDDDAEDADDSPDHTEADAEFGGFLETGFLHSFLRCTQAKFNL